LGRFGMDRAGGKYSRHLPPKSEASSSSFSVRSDGAIGDGVVGGLLELILRLE
jgi:hypothetical protein